MAVGLCVFQLLLFLPVSGVVACVHAVASFVCHWLSSWQGLGELQRSFADLDCSTVKSMASRLNMPRKWLPHMALGLLFLGGGRYTLSTSPASTAAMLCAFFPIFPAHPGDNRAHLQAARHLWVLAVEPRCLTACDVDSNEAIYLPIRLRICEVNVIRSQLLVSPTLIPEMKLVESISVDSPRYWPVTLQIATNRQHYENFLRNRTLFVKRRRGYLTYAQDPRGIKSVFSRSDSESGRGVFDFGSTAAICTPPSASTLQDFVTAFASEADALAVIRRLCPQLVKRVGRIWSSNDVQFEAFCASALMDCLMHDKLGILPVYFSLFHAKRIIYQGDSIGSASLFALHNMVLLTTFTRPNLTCSPSPVTKASVESSHTELAPYLPPLRIETDVGAPRSIESSVDDLFPGRSTAMAGY